MKKLLKICISILLINSLLAAICFSVSAETYYVLDGFTYRDVDDGVSIHAWDYSSDTMTVPQLLGGTRVVAIDDFAFNNDENINNVDFSEASYLTTIGKMSFLGSALSGKLDLTPSITEIGTGAFQDCIGITSVKYNAALVDIPNQCFKNCYSLSSVEISTAVHSIGAYAFQNCYSLETITIPKTVETIKPSAFSGDSIIIYCYKNTYAHTFAIEQKYAYVLLDGDKIGDVNGDGVVDILDATEIQKYAAESTDFTDEQFELGDINKDGYCDVIDALLVQKSVIGAYELPQNIIRY